MGKKRNHIRLVGGRDMMPEMPDLADLYTMAYKIINDLPERFRQHIDDLIIRIENFADEDTLDNLKIDDKYDLLGLYRGVPLPLKLGASPLSLPDFIYLYRCPIVRYAKENKEDIFDVIHHVLIHEIGHHFGFDDHDMELIEIK
ncbi:MAG TPA: metallopeptidase family protein [Candidatus Nitrosotenuis sp.]|jgi:predicted Zn-dependent protease with MMP-like domain|nr:metallopeptidase family protein [Candidatus Nitrosotenuis sp.]